MVASKFELLEAAEEARPHGTDKPSASPVYELAGGRAIQDDLRGVSNLAQLFMRSVKQYPDNDCLGTRDGTGEYKFLTYSQVAARVDAIGSALAGLGLKKGNTVGILGANCQQWMVAMQACNRMAYITVPLYDTLGENAVQYIMNHSSTQVVFVEGAKLPELAKVVGKVGGLLKHIIYWGEAPQEAIDLASSGGANVVAYEEFFSAGEASPVEGVTPGADDLCTIMYTSGTTGDPKGVMIKHKNVLAEISALQRYLIHTGHKQDQHDVFLSYLPLAHIFDRVAEEFYLSIGAKIGFWRGNAKLLTEDIVALKPTMFVGVPRIFERVIQGIQAKMHKAGCLTTMLFNYAMRHKKYYMERGIPQDKASPLFDALVFSKIKAALGGHVKIIISGGAPLSPHIEDFLKVAMCAVVAQGYGLTETLAGISISLPNGSGGNVGPPLPGVQIRLESTPELGYDALDYPPRGEVLVRAELVTSGYYKAEDKTKEVLEEDGWFHTGDIGEILADGSLKIIDRKKNIFKLSQGEYIAVEKVESVFSKDDFVDQLWVYGNSFNSALVCVVVPNPSKLKACAQESGVESADLKDICQAEAVKKAVLASMTKTGRAGGLKGFEIVKAVHLEAEPFDIDRDLITPTFKLKRPQLLKYYQKEVDSMYAVINA